jgi:hypothetical protein
MLDEPRELLDLALLPLKPPEPPPTAEEPLDPPPPPVPPPRLDALALGLAPPPRLEVLALGRAPAPPPRLPAALCWRALVWRLPPRADPPYLLAVDLFE